MLETEEKSLRWLGIDMRARWRRRVAVLVTYLAFLTAIGVSQGDWSHPLIVMVALVAAVMMFGVLGWRGPVKSFEEPDAHTVPLKAYSDLDEREMRERDGSARWTLRWVSTFLACLAGGYAVVRRPVSGMDVAATLTLLWVLVVTLPKARVLWTERDPREIVGEIELVGPKV
jgi:hypothetical protein